MKATGIVRRIDDLGRVVIPKEIRRTMRIREGDPLEIYTASEGEVIFKKYSPIGEVSLITEQYAEVLSKSINMPVLISDRDHIIVSSGVPKKEVIDRRVSVDLEAIMESRGNFIATSNNDKFLPVEGVSRNASLVFPIIGAGDVSGAVIALAPDKDFVPTQTETKLTQVAASFLGKQMEE